VSGKLELFEIFNITFLYERLINGLAYLKPMELVVLEETPKKLVLEMRGESHTFCNALKQELYGSENVKVATYMKKHPLVGHPVFILETDGDAKPRKVMADAADRLEKGVTKLRTAVARELK